MKLFAVLVFSLLAAQAQAGEVYVLKVEGVIDPVISKYVERGIKAASAANAETVIIQIDTPGGLDTAMREIIKSIFESDVAVVTYVYPSGARSASAGAFIMMASHAAAMTPGTNIGAASPVAMGGNLNGTMAEKVTNDAAAYMRSIAEQRGRNVSIAVSFVLNATSISASEALESGVIELVANSYGELLEKLDGRKVVVKSGEKVLRTKNASIVTLPMSPREEFLHIIANPNIAYILMIVGIWGIIFELQSPGAILPGIIGVVSLLLAFWSFQAISLSVAGLALILFGILLFIADVYSPTHGILTTGGIASLLLGSMMLIDAEKEPFVQISLSVILLTTLFTAIFFAFAISLAVKAMKLKPATGIEGMIGETGVVKQELAPEGYAMIRGELWKARAKAEAIAKDKKVKVVGADNLVLIVEEAKEEV